MHRIGRLQVERAVRSLVVVDVDVDVGGLADHASGPLQIRWTPESSAFSRMPFDAGGRIILVAVVSIGHRVRHAVTLTQRLVVGRAVPDAPIVVN